MVVPDIDIEVVSAGEKQSAVAYSAEGQTEGRLTVIAMPGGDVDPTVCAILGAASSVILNRRHPSAGAPEPGSTSGMAI